LGRPEKTLFNDDYDFDDDPAFSTELLESEDESIFEPRRSSPKQIYEPKSFLGRFRNRFSQ